MIKAFPGGWDAIAAALGMSRNALENRVYERKGQGLLVETARQLQEFSDTDHFTEAMCAARGGVFLKLPTDVSDDNEEMWAKAQQLHIELGRFFEDVKKATEDGVIDAREQAVLDDDEARVHKVMAELHALVRRLYTPHPRREVA
jgi:hypothetical protein